MRRARIPGGAGIGLLLAGASLVGGATCAPGGRVGPGCVDAPEQWTLPSSIPEASGLAVSRRHPGVVWTHNDGRDSTLWALLPDSAPPGSVLAPAARVKVDAESWDWEALEAAPCPEPLGAGPCLWIADSGNNGLYRETARLHILPEPELRAGSVEGTAPTIEPVVVHLRYPDARQDVEALFVADGVPWLVSKGNTGAASLYRVALPRQLPVAPPGPGSARAPLVAERVRELAPNGLNLVRQITGAATVPGAPARVLLRSYTQLRLFMLADTLAAPVDGGEVNLMPLREAQGEAVAVGDDGRVWLASEGGPTAGRGGLSVIRCEQLERR